MAWKLSGHTGTHQERKEAARRSSAGIGHDGTCVWCGALLDQNYECPWCDELSAGVTGGEQ